jgi:ATP-binding cassette subfamily B multidrug efflux pump
MRRDMGYFEEQHLDKAHNVRLLRRLYPFSRPYRLLIGVSILLVMLITLLDLAVPYITKVAIDRYIVPVLEGSNTLEQKAIEKNNRLLEVNLENPGVERVVQKYPQLFSINGSMAVIHYTDLKKLPPGDLARLRQGDIMGVTFMALLFLALIALNFGLNFIQKIIMEYTGHMMMHDLRMALFRHIQSLAISFFTRNPVGRLVTRATNDVQNMHELFTSVITLVFKDFFLLVGIAAVLLFMDWRLALVSFAVFPLVVYAAFFFSGRIREVFRILRLKVAEINTTFSETIEGLKVIQAFGRERPNNDDFSRLNHENYQAGMREIHVLAIFMPLIEVFGVATVAIVIFFGGNRVLQDGISLGVLVAFISYMRMFFRPIRDLAEKFNILQNAMASAERLFLIMDSQEKIPDTGDKDASVAAHSAKTLRELTFEHVDFAYVPAEPLLKDINWWARTGETVAIVGPTGSGKTSIINLITRFYDPAAGRILWNGNDIKSIPASALRSRMALVTQDPTLFSDSVMANIWRHEQHPSEKEIKEVLTASNCMSLVTSLPQGIDTILTGGGSTLSSGERQLLSIARAFASSPDLIILDEATSYIDSQTEKEIQNALATLLTGRTAIVVAHRLSTIRKADRILVLDRGRIIETGTHETLMRKKGFYFRLNHQQTCVGPGCDQIFSS